jgi:hypothetical protein
MNIATKGQVTIPQDLRRKFGIEAHAEAFPRGPTAGYRKISLPSVKVANLPRDRGCTGSLLDQGQPPNWSLR